MDVEAGFCALRGRASPRLGGAARGKLALAARPVKLISGNRIVRESLEERCGAFAGMSSRFLGVLFSPGDELQIIQNPRNRLRAPQLFLVEPAQLP